jgi:hypothetical protein
LTKRKTLQLGDFQYNFLSAQAIVTFLREAKYENLIQRLESNRVRKRGMAVPTDYTQRVHAIEQKKLAERKAKREQLLTKEKTLLKKLRTKDKE